MERIPIEELHARALGASVTFPFSEEVLGHTWEFWESVNCEGVVARFSIWNTVGDEFIEGADTREEVEDVLARLRENGEDPDDLEVREEPDGHDTDGEGRCANPACSRFDGFSLRSGPVREEYFPFVAFSRFDPKEAARKLSYLPLCVVRVGGQYGLALTGGGMDLSWQIAEAFTRLGMLPPPMNVLDLPAMQYADGETELYVIEACKRAARVQIEHMNAIVATLIELAAQLEGDVE